jgi:hypothetical protein
LTPQRFFLLLALSATAMALGIGALEWAPSIARHRALFWSSWAALLGFSLLVYFGAGIALKSPNRNAFSGFFLLSILPKMALCLIVLLAYRKQCPDLDALAVLPFFGVYLGFTVFEVYFLEKMAKAPRP